MRKCVLLMAVSICAAVLLTGCVGRYAANTSEPDAEARGAEQSEEAEMKHEIITVSELFDDYLVGCNDKDEQYIIRQYQKYGLNLEVGSRIGISYTGKQKTVDEMYELSIAAITKEGPFKLVPNEK